MTHAILSGRRILVMEDEALVAMLIEELFQEEDCDVVGPFGTLAEGLRAVETERFDVALLDVNLSGETVYPLAERLAARRIPFVLLSGQGRDAIPPDHRDWVACPKPFRAAALTDLVARQLGRAEPPALAQAVGRG